MKRINETKLATVLASISSPLLGKKALAYMMKNISGMPLTYYQKKKKETVQGTIQPDQLIVVQPGSEYHFVKPGNHDLEHPITTHAAALELAQQRGGASVTSEDFINAAVMDLLKNNPGLTANGIEFIGWVNSTNFVRAYRLPGGFGEFEVDKTKSWGEMQPGNDNHALVVTDGADTGYCNLLDNLRDDWFVLNSNESGEALLAKLPVLDDATIADAIEPEEAAAA